MPAIPAEDEEDDQNLPPKPQIGTTGGVIPEQQSDIDARKPVKWQADPMARQQQVRQEIDKRRQAAFQKEHPFTPSGWQPKINTQDTRREDREFESDAEAQYQYQEQSARANEVEKRRQGIAARNASNNKLEAQYRGSGQQFYTDADGALQPIIDTESGRPLFHATGWEVGEHPKTGKPALTMRDKYGQRQFKEPPVVQSLDPMDDQMHYKLPDGTTVAAGSIDDFAKSPNYTVAKAALAAKTRQVKAVHQEALQPIRLMADQAVAQLEDAKVELQGIDAEIEKLSMQVANSTGPDGSPTPLSEGLGASLSQLQARRDQIDGMIKPRGELAQKAARAKAGFAIASATAMREAFLAQQAEIAARVKSQGGNLEADPTYQANLRGLRSAEQILGQGEQQMGIRDAQAATSTPAAVPSTGPGANAPATSAAPLEQSEPYIASQNGVKNVGSVKIAEFARRYGDGRGPVKPTDLIKLHQRSKEIEQTLSNGDTTLNQTMRDQFTKEKDYIDSLAKQRFARLPEDQQKRVAEISRDSNFWDVTKGAGKSTAEGAAVGGGGVFKGLGNLMEQIGPMTGGFEGGGPRSAEQVKMLTDFQEQRAKETPSQRMDRIKNNPVYKFGSFIQDAAKDAYSKNPHEEEGMVSQAINAASEAAGGFAPLVASGPAAPLTAGLQATGDQMESLYNEQIQKGATKDQAAKFAVDRALASGAVQATLFAVLPKPLQKAGSKIVVDKIAGDGLMKFLANRVAQAGEGAVIGGVSKGAENLTADRPIGEGVPAAAAGMAAMQAVMPREGGPAKPKAGEPAPKPEPKAPLTPEQKAAEAEFQKQLAEPAEPTKPSTAEEAAQTFEPALKEKANTPPPAKSAKESASAIADVQDAAEANSKVLSQQEGKAQKLVDKIQEATGKSREEILATRKGRDASEWAKELETEAKYQKSPLTVDPERRSTELRADLKKLDAEWNAHREMVSANAERLAKTPSQGDVYKSTVEADRARHESLTERRNAIEQQLTEADRLRQSPTGGEELKKQLASEEVSSEAESRKLKTPDLEARRDAIEQGMTEQDRTRQSAKGGADLKNDLAQRSGEPPSPPTAPSADSKPVGPSPLGDQPVKVELRRGKTGETIEVEMPARVAEKRINDHITTLGKVLACLGGGR